MFEWKIVQSQGFFSFFSLRLVLILPLLTHFNSQYVFVKCGTWEIHHNLQLNWDTQCAAGVERGRIGGIFTAKVPWNFKKGRRELKTFLKLLHREWWGERQDLRVENFEMTFLRLNWKTNREIEKERKFVEKLVWLIEIWKLSKWNFSSNKQLSSHSTLSRLHWVVEKERENEILLSFKGIMLTRFVRNFLIINGVNNGGRKSMEKLKLCFYEQSNVVRKRWEKNVELSIKCSQWGQG